MEINAVFTVLLVCCQEGHLFGWKWLFEVCAAAEITMAGKSDFTT